MKENSMKKLIVAGLLFAAPQAFSHGNLVVQTAGATNAALALFQASYADHVNNLGSLYAVHAGHETFNVTITLKDNAQINMQCRENESVEPVVWECAAF